MRRLALVVAAVAIALHCSVGGVRIADAARWRARAASSGIAPDEAVGPQAPHRLRRPERRDGRTRSTRTGRSPPGRPPSTTGSQPRRGACGFRVDTFARPARRVAAEPCQSPGFFVCTPELPDACAPRRPGRDRSVARRRPRPRLPLRRLERRRVLGVGRLHQHARRGRSRDRDLRGESDRADRDRGAGSRDRGRRRHVREGGLLARGSTTTAQRRCRAVPAKHWHFVGWAGACPGTSPACRVTAKQSLSVRAAFARS